MTIAIPACNTRSYCQKLLDDLLTSIVAGEYNDQVLVMFDSCDKFFVSYFLSKYPNIKAFLNRGKGFGFAKNSNIGLSYAHQHVQDDGVFLINMDTILPHSKYLYRMKNKGISGANQVDLRPDLSLEAINNINEQEFEKVNTLKMSGFALWISKEAMDTVGYLDDGFVSSFEDDDICARVALAGLPVEQTNVNIQHYIKERQVKDKNGNVPVITTTGAYDGVRLHTSRLRYMAKWSIPHNVPHEQYNKWIMDNHTWSEDMAIRISGVKA